MTKPPIIVRAKRPKPKTTEPAAVFKNSPIIQTPGKQNMVEQGFQRELQRRLAELKIE